MTMQGGMSAGGRKLGLALIALGLAFRILIAPGLMPQASPEGLTLTLCTAQGPVEYRLDLHKAQPEPAAHDPCPYGALAAVPLLPELAVAVAPLVFEAATLLSGVPAKARPHVGAPAPPPSTGPPTRIHCARCRSEEHTSELQSLMRISYAVFCLKTKNRQHKNQ